MAGGLCLR